MSFCVSPPPQRANLFRIDVLSWSGHRSVLSWPWTITEGRARFRIGTQWFSRSGCWNRRERVLGNEPSQLSPESTNYQPPRDVLGAVWSQGRGSLSGGKRRKTRCIGEADVSRTGEENAARRGHELRRACLWGLEPETAEAVKTVEKTA